MFESWYLAVRSIALPVNFVCAMTVFVGAMFVLLKNQHLPQWHKAPLNMLAVACGFLAVTILSQWVFGVGFGLAYDGGMGLIAEVGVNLCIASIAAVFMVSTFLRQQKDAKQLPRRAAKSLASRGRVRKPPEGPRRGHKSRSNKARVGRVDAA